MGRTLSLSPWDRRTRGATNSYLHTALNKQETPLGESKLNILFPDLQRVRCVDSTDQSMLSTGHRHRVTDALNKTHAHFAPRKLTKALKVCSCATRERFYCESFYVLPPHLLPVWFPTGDCPRVDLDGQRSLTERNTDENRQKSGLIAGFLRGWHRI